MRILFSTVAIGLFLVIGLQFLPGQGDRAPVRAAQQKSKDIKPVTTKSISTCFFCQFCTKCHCGKKRRGNKKLNVCDLKSLVNEKPTADILKEYPKAKGYIVPGKPEQSLVWLRVADGTMPESGRKPTKKHKADLKKWIEGLKVETGQAEKRRDQLVRYDDGEKPKKQPPLCPVSDRPIDKKIKAEFLGKTIYFADIESAKKFNGNYGPYLYRAYLQMLRTGNMRLVACPILGDPLSDEYKAELGGFEFRFCCEPCFKKFTNKNLSDIERLWLVFKNPNIGFTLQDKCPITDKQLPEDPPWINASEGRRVWVFDDKAMMEYQKNPQKFAAKLPRPFPGIDPDAPMTQERLGYAAYKIITNRCMGCHNANHPDGIDFTSPDNITPKQIWSYVKDGRMPLDSAPLSFEEKSILKEWVDGKAFKPKEWGRPARFVMPEPRPGFVTLKDSLQAMVTYLKNAETRKEDPKNIRFFTLTHLHNDSENISTRQMRLFRAAVSKMVNSLSTKNQIKRPTPVPATSESILAIDISDYGWHKNGKWNKILNEYPYGVDYTTYKGKNANEQKDIRDSAKHIADLSLNKMAFVRGDWFVAVASQPPLYHILAETPATLTELEKKMLGGTPVDFAKALDNGSLYRMATDSGLTTYQNRLVEGYKTKPNFEMGKDLVSYYYRSYDFDPHEPRSSLVDYPLGPLVAKNPYWPYAFKHGGGEIIYTLPNGLQAYMVVDAQGNRQDVGDIRFLKDPLVPPTANTPALVNGLSCIGCHRHGLNTVTFSNTDFVAPAWNKRKLVGPAVDTVLKIYQNQFFDKQYEEREQFIGVLKKTMGPFLEDGADKVKDTKKVNSIKRFSEPVRALSLQFYKYLGLRQVALELGIEPTDELKDLRDKIKKHPRLSATGLLDIPIDVGKPATANNGGSIKVRGRQRINFGIRRGQNITQFQMLARELGIGTPFWKRYHRQPMDVPDLIAQLASDIAGFLKYETRLKQFKVDLRQFESKGGKMEPQQIRSLSSHLQQELSRHGIEATAIAKGTVSAAKYVVIPKLITPPDDIKIAVSAKIVDQHGSILGAKHFNRSLTGPLFAMPDRAHEQVIKEASWIAFHGGNIVLNRKDLVVARMAKVMKKILNSAVHNVDGDCEARVHKDFRTFAIQFLEPTKTRTLELKNQKQGAMLLLNKGDKFRIRLVNRSNQEVAVRLSVDGVSIFAFNPNWTHDVAPPSVVLVPAKSSKVVEGWYINANEHEPFQAGSYAGQSFAGSKRGSVTAVFSPSHSKPNDELRKDLISDAVLKGTKLPLIIQRGALQLNQRVYQRAQRYVGQAVAAITVDYAEKSK